MGFPETIEIISIALHETNPCVMFGMMEVTTKSFSTKENNTVENSLIYFDINHFLKESESNQNPLHIHQNWTIFENYF